MISREALWRSTVYPLDRLIAGSVINGMRHKMLQSALWKQAGAVISNERWLKSMVLPFLLRIVSDSDSCAGR